MDVETLIIQPTIDVGRQLSQILCDRFSWVLGTFVATIPIFALVLIVTLVGRRWFSPWARHALWTLVLVRLILPISVISTVSVQQAWFLSKFSKPYAGRLMPGWLLSVGGMPTSGSYLSDLNDSGSASTPSVSLISQLQQNLFASIMTLMMAGTLVIAGASAIAFARFVGWVRYSRECSDPFCLEQAEQARRSLGIGTCVRMRTVHELTCAATFDWFWPMILLPENVGSMSETERKFVVWHEMARLRRGDSGFSILFTVVRMLHWWNPIFWWAGSSWKTEQELACDVLTIQRLGQEQSSEFAHTLKQLNQTTAKRSRLAVEAPGFILLLDSKPILRQRIQAMSSSLPSEGRLKFWFSLCIVATIAVTGLTDAPSVPLQKTPIELPTGTTWHNSDAAEKTPEETETRTYDITQYIARWHDPKAPYPIEITTEQLLHSINGLLKPIVYEMHAARSNNKPASPDEWRSRLVGNELIVRATPTQHEGIAHLIEHWSTYGEQQLTVEFQSVTTRLELSQLAPGMGGKVYNSKSIASQFDSSLSRRVNEPIGVTANQAVHSSLPVFVRTLTSSESKFVIRRTQGELRTNLLFSPKVTLFDGTTGIMADQTFRPFVTGFRNGENDSDSVVAVDPPLEKSIVDWPNGSKGFDPVITTCLEGVQIQEFALIESGKVRLRVGCRITNTTDVAVRKFQTGSEELSIQVPQSREFLFESTSVLESGETLMFCPLERDSRGNLTIFLITPKIIDMSQ